MSQVRDIALVSAFLLSYVYTLVLITIGAVRAGRRRGERVSLYRLWVAGVVAAFGTAYVVAASVNILL